MLCQLLLYTALKDGSLEYRGLSVGSHPFVGSVLCILRMCRGFCASRVVDGGCGGRICLGHLDVLVAD